MGAGACKEALGALPDGIHVSPTAGKNDVVTYEANDTRDRAGLCTAGNQVCQKSEIKKVGQTPSYNDPISGFARLQATTG